MTLEEFAKLVKRMRDKQKEYFRLRNGTVLSESKNLEGHIDRAVEEILNPKAPGLFDEPIQERQP